jgi:hypothetical protein
MWATLIKAIGIWFIIVILAILNGAIREKLLTPNIGSSVALPLSGLLLSILIVSVAFATVPFFGSPESKTYIFTGVIWFVLTLSFEFLFGHYIAGKPWHEIIQVFNIKKGDLFIVALFATLISPWLSAKLRGLI